MSAVSYSKDWPLNVIHTTVAFPVSVKRAVTSKQGHEVARPGQHAEVVPLDVLAAGPGFGTGVVTERNDSVRDVLPKLCLADVSCLFAVIAHSCARPESNATSGVMMSPLAVQGHRPMRAEQ